MPDGKPDIILPDHEDLHLARLKSDLKSVSQFMKTEESSWWSSWFEKVEDDKESSDDEEYVEMTKTWYFEELVESALNRPAFSFRNDPEDEDDIEDDNAPILQVHLWNPPRKSKAIEIQGNEPLVGDVCIVDTEKYADYWPQIGEIKEIEDDNITIIWFKGARTTPWRPWMIRQGKNRVAWTESIAKEDIIFAGFKLTPGGKLTQDFLRKLDIHERRWSTKLQSQLLCGYSSTEGRDSSIFDYRGIESADNVHATYNIMIYNNHVPYQRFGKSGDILLVPMHYPSKTRDTQFRRIDIQSSHINRELSDQDIQRQPMKMMNNLKNSESQSDLKKPAQMLYDLLKKYGSFSDSDFRSVYNQCFGQ